MCIFEVRDQTVRVSQFKRRSSLFGERDSMATTAQCANLVGREEPICGGPLHSFTHKRHNFWVITGVVYTLDRVLLPNPPTILRLVKAKQEFSRFLQLLEFAQMSEEVGEYIGILLTSRHLLSSV